MRWMNNPKIAFGLITREFTNPRQALLFLENAATHGHSVERLIISYSHRFDPRAVAAVQEHVPVDLLQSHGDPTIKQRLLALGLEPDIVHGILHVPSWRTFHEVPYGAYRNTVLLQALLTGIEYLIFFDTDVQPRVLLGIEQDHIHWQEVDYIQAHIASLRQDEVAATTSEYSGYYIIPPMAFDGFSELLYGLGKGMALDYMQDCQEHKCLNLGPAHPGIPKPTHKPLGGNLGLCLNRPWRLSPFFSTTYVIHDQCIKGRGEDTLLGQALMDSQRALIDIDLRIFHDTFDDFPAEPDIARKSIRDRFFGACLGWIGRNPFMTWFLDRAGRLENSFESELILQQIGLEIGGEKAAIALGDARFLDLPAAFKASLAALPGCIEQYERLMQGWKPLIRILYPQAPFQQMADEGNQEFRLAS